MFGHRTGHRALSHIFVLRYIYVYRYIWAIVIPIGCEGKKYGKDEKVGGARKKWVCDELRPLGPNVLAAALKSRLIYYYVLLLLFGYLYPYNIMPREICTEHTFATDILNTRMLPREIKTLSTVLVITFIGNHTRNDLILLCQSKNHLFHVSRDINFKSVLKLHDLIFLANQSNLFIYWFINNYASALSHSRKFTSFFSWT